MIRLNHCIHVDYCYDVFTTFWTIKVVLKWNLDGGTEISQVSFKYHRLEDKQKSYGLSVLGELSLGGGVL